MIRDMTLHERYEAIYDFQPVDHLPRQDILVHVPWVPGMRVADSIWTAKSADMTRKRLANVAIVGQQSAER